MHHPAAAATRSIPPADQKFSNKTRCGLLISIIDWSDRVVPGYSVMMGQAHHELVLTNKSATQ